MAKGHRYDASWTKTDDGWKVRLEPKGGRGKLPPSGAVLEVIVARRGKSSQKMKVRVVEELVGRNGKAFASLAHPIREEHQRVQARKRNR